MFTHVKDSKIRFPDELHSKEVKLNGKILQLGVNDDMPSINGKDIKAGNVELPPLSITFITFSEK